MSFVFCWDARKVVPGRLFCELMLVFFSATRQFFFFFRFEAMSTLPASVARRNSHGDSVARKNVVRASRSGEIWSTALPITARWQRGGLFPSLFSSFSHRNAVLARWKNLGHPRQWARQCLLPPFDSPIPGHNFVYREWGSVLSRRTIPRSFLGIHQKHSLPSSSILVPRVILRSVLLRPCNSWNNGVEYLYSLSNDSYV